MIIVKLRIFKVKKVLRFLNAFVSPHRPTPNRCKLRDLDDKYVIPHFSVTKLSIAGSILFIMVRKHMVQFATAEVLLCIACVGSVLQVVMYLSNTSDPFTHLEKAVAAVLFREPTEKANTSDSKKKKE